VELLYTSLFKNNDKTQIDIKGFSEWVVRILSQCLAHMAHLEPADMLVFSAWQLCLFDVSRLLLALKFPSTQ